MNWFQRVRLPKARLKDEPGVIYRKTGRTKEKVSLGIKTTLVELVDKRGKIWVPESCIMTLYR